jgi:hypothetical protein
VRYHSFACDVRYLISFPSCVDVWSLVSELTNSHCYALTNPPVLSSLLHFKPGRPLAPFKSNNHAVLVRVSCACVSERKFPSLEIPRITLDHQAAISLRDFSLVMFYILCLCQMYQRPTCIRFPQVLRLTIDDPSLPCMS